jgi:hypothetical protein
MKDIPNILKQLNSFFYEAIIEKSYKFDGQIYHPSITDDKKVLLRRVRDFLYLFNENSKHIFLEKCETLMKTDLELLKQIFPSLTDDIILEYNKPTDTGYMNMNPNVNVNPTSTVPTTRTANVIMPTTATATATVNANVNNGCGGKFPCVVSG